MANADETVTRERGSVLVALNTILLNGEDPDGRIRVEKLDYPESTLPRRGFIIVRDRDTGHEWMVKIEPLPF